jgi:hypothetical protein
MSSTIFWKPNSGPSRSGMGSINLKNKSGGPRTVNKKLVKVLGISGGALLGVVAVVSLVLFVFVIRPAYAVMSNARDLKNDLSMLQQALQERDVIKMEAAFDKTEKDLKEFRVARDKNFMWASKFGLTKNYFQDSEHFINAGLIAVDAGRETVILVRPFADAAGLKISEEQKTQTLGLAEAFATWISVMPKVANDMDPVLEKLAEMGTVLKNVNPDRYPESFRGTPIRGTIVFSQNTLGQVSEYGPDIKEALNTIPGLLGVGTGEKRYMIIMQNDKEIRATGGFWTNYATFKIRNAMLNSDFSSKDMYSIDLTLDAIDAYHTFPKAPDAYMKYLKVERMYARDANISPDYPTAIDQFMYFYKLAMPLAPADIKPVDGIIAIDTQVIKELMEITGPVTVNGVTYTSDNVVLELEKIASLALREQAGRKKVLGDLMEAMLLNVFESDGNLWPQLIEKGADLAIRKHILVYSTDVQAQALLEKYNLAGRIIDPVEGDYSYVVSTNLGGDKTNWFVTREIEHSLEKENGKYVRTVKIKYEYPQPSAEYGAFVKRFRDWVRVYAPANSQLIGVTGSAGEGLSFDERNKKYFTGYIELGPTETGEMTFKYYLPDNVIKNGLYDLYLQKQPGTNGEIHKVIVNGKTEVIELSMDKKFQTKL